MGTMILPNSFPKLLSKKAKKNIGKWGVQTIENVALAIAEESGEVAQAVLQYRHEGGDLSRIIDESIDLGALCIQMFISTSYEAKKQCMKQEDK